MPRTRWIVVGVLFAVAIIGTAINSHGPFADRPTLAYPRFLADSAAGRVDQIVQWRDQLEVTEGTQLLRVTVPADADLAADFALARQAGGGVGFSWASVPDNWLGSYTPWIPLLLLISGAVIWVRAVVDGRSRPVSPLGAGAS